MNEFDRRNIEMLHPRLYRDTIEFSDRGTDILLRTCKDEVYVFEIVNERMSLITRDFRKVTHEEIHKEFLRQIKYRMLLKGILQSDLADICGVAQTTISRYLSGFTIPDVFTANRIAEALDCSVDELIFKPTDYFNIDLL